MSTAHAAHELAPAKQPSLFLTVVGGFALLALFLGVGLLFLGKSAAAFKDVDAQRETERWKILEDVNAAVKKTQEEGPVWVSKEKGLVRLSAEKAMQLEMERLKGRKPHPANAIEAPPAAAAVPAAAPAPATPKPASSAPAPTTAPAAPASAPAAPAASPAPAPVPAPSGN